MPSEADKNNCCPDQEVTEVFHLQMQGDDWGSFLEKGEQVNHFLSGLEGYKGMNILLLSETESMVLINWNSFKLFEQNLSKILNACPITDWFRSVMKVTHQPALLRTYAPLAKIA